MMFYHQDIMAALAGVHLKIGKRRALVDVRYITKDAGDNTIVYFTYEEEDLDDTCMHDALLRDFCTKDGTQYSYREMLEKIPEQNRPRLTA